MDLSFFRSKKVLVIEDCAPVRATIKGMLQQMGFGSVHLARDSNEAIEACNNIPFDLVLSDFNLGECKDGYQLFEYLKCHELLPAMNCFIMISAENQSQIVHGLIELQPADYLLKPFTLPQLQERITKAMLQKRAFRKVYLALFDHDYQEAIEQCKSISRRNDEHQINAQRLLGELLLKTKKFEEAELFYKNFLAVKSLPWARLGHAVSSLNLQRWKETETELTELIQLKECRVEALDWQSRAFLRQHLYQDAYDALHRSSQLSPKNIKRQKTLVSLSYILNDIANAARINARLVREARFSLDDTPDNYLNYARALIDQANQANALEQSVLLRNAEKELDTIDTRFSPDNLQTELTVVRSRILQSRNELRKARDMLQEISPEQVRVLTIDSCIDAMKAFYEIGDLCGCELCAQRLEHMLNNDDYLTEAQLVLLSIEQTKHLQLKTQLKEANTNASAAYESGDYTKATELFCITYDFMPGNPIVALNLLQSASKSKQLSADCLNYTIKAIASLQQQTLDQQAQERLQRYLAQLRKRYKEMS